MTDDDAVDRGDLAARWLLARRRLREAGLVDDEPAVLSEDEQAEMDALAARGEAAIVRLKHRGLTHRLHEWRRRRGRPSDEAAIPATSRVVERPADPKPTRKPAEKRQAPERESGASWSAAERRGSWGPVLFRTGERREIESDGRQWGPSDVARPVEE